VAGTDTKPAAYPTRAVPRWRGFTANFKVTSSDFKLWGSVMWTADKVGEQRREGGFGLKLGLSGLGSYGSGREMGALSS